VTELQVWAPDAGLVEAVLADGNGIPMDRYDRPGRPGWWRADVEALKPGGRYGFSLDGGPTRPDPRSKSQPDGPDGWSQVVDLTSFEWADAGWEGIELADAVIYELHVGTFSPEGTFRSAIERLGHLVDLGVAAVELMPVAEFPGRRGWGYDGVDLYAPHHAYGGPAGLLALVDACHQRGLAVIFDVVYNHLGPSGNHLGDFGPYFTDRYVTPWGQAVNLDGPGSDEVRRFFIDNALLWLRDFRGDGLRLDAVHAIVDTSALHFLEQLGQEVDRLEREVGRRLFVIAESDLNDPRTVTPRHRGGHGLDAQWSDDFHHALHAVLTGERDGYYGDFGEMSQLAYALRHAFVYDGRYSPHRRRTHGRPVHRPGAVSGDQGPDQDGRLEGGAFLGYLQNHDQIGNRATGERSSTLLSVGRLKIAAALVLLSPFVPMLFQGEEWAASTPFQYFTDHTDADLGRAVSEGRRREFAAFGWEPEEVPDPQDPATFERSRLEWAELTRPPHNEVLRWHRSLIALRRARADLRDGRLDAVEVTYGADWIAMRRGRLVVAANLAGAPAVIALPGDSKTQLLASDDKVALVEGGVQLPSDSVAVIALG
jgi:maltooligosyltrehalose trehalohydrolase